MSKALPYEANLLLGIVKILDGAREEDMTVKEKGIAELLIMGGFARYDNLVLRVDMHGFNYAPHEKKST